ncbi:MAG TPA: NAD(P)-dependent oxidoreductase [Acidothermaceae bacterium]|jgi:3-hydroxyisobutyrate dehydrogenase-like beta-hydroxyacid dehydrogenase
MSGIGKDDGIAVIGLGKMGLPMARNLRTAGFRVCGYDPVPAACEAAKAVGVDIVDSPASAAASTAIALIVVGFDNEVEQVVTSEDAGLLAGAKSGYVITICSTIEPNTSIRLAEITRKHEVELVDATMCLGEPAAEDGTLLFMCGGDSAALDRIQPALEVVGANIFRLGDVGTGQVGKMLNNYLLWSCVVGNYEAMRLGARLGVDLEPLRQALLLSSGANWALDTWLRSRPMPWAEDDMRIVMQYADEVKLPMPAAGLLREEMKAIKVVKNAWTEGGGAKSSMDAFTRAHI